MNHHLPRNGFSLMGTRSSVVLCIGSQNPVKIRGIVEAFSKFYNVSSVKSMRVVTGIPPQPIGLEQIVEGARRRAMLVFSNECDFAVGLEAGFYTVNSEPYDVEVAYIISKTGEVSLGFSPSFPIPRRIYSAITRGVYTELEEAVEKLFNVEKIGDKEGFIGLLTKRVCDRWLLSYYATLMALVKFINKDLYAP
jgi:inosine/xanthosine triphosphatase